MGKYLLILSLFFCFPLNKSHARDIILSGANTNPVNSIAKTRSVTNTATGVLLSTVTASPATGSISACVGTASASPNVQQFTVSGTGLTGNITMTAPAGFEVSIASGSGYGSSVTIPQISGAVSNTVVYVRSSSAAPTGSISGNVILTSAGASNQTVAVTGTVNALPTVNPVANQTVNNGAATTAINFTGTGNNFTWVNDTPAIGLAASGTGNIASFSAINTGNSPVVATVIASPISPGFAYIPNQGDNTVSVINIVSNKVIATINVGKAPSGAAVSPDGTRAYITNQTSGTVSVIDVATNTVVATISVGTSPYAIDISPDGSSVYVANLNSNTISVINTATSAIVKTIPVGLYPFGIAISPDGANVYVTNQSTISVINSATNTVIKTINIGVVSSGIAISPDGNTLYVTNPGNIVSVINVATQAVVATIPVGSGPVAITLSPNGMFAYVANQNSNNISVINTTTNGVVKTIPVGAGPTGISSNVDGSLLYVPNGGANTVSVINTATGSVVTVINVGTLPNAAGNFISAGTGCTGAPIKFTITVNPASPIITTTTATGTISVCIGTASASPNIQQLTVSGSGLTGNITATAPTGFEVSLVPGSGYASSVSIPQTSGAVSNTVVYIRSAATAAAGNISGNVTLASAGANTQTVAVTGTVSALPIVDTVANQTVNNGVATAPVNFTGTGNAFNWVNDTPGIGLPASGTGNITSFTAVNTGNTPVTATVTVTPALAPYAYITNATGPVSVINTLTDTAVGTISLPNPFGVAVSPDGAFVYISNNTADGLISIIATSTNKVIGTITAGFSLGAEAISADGSKLYVTSYPASVLVINTKTKSLINTIAADSPSGIALSPDGSRLWLTNPSSGTVTINNTANNAIVNVITVGLHPTAVTLSPDGSLAYVTVANSNYVSVINTATYKVVSTIPVGTFPLGEVLNANGSLLYVANQGSNSVSVINTLTNAVVATIGVGTHPDGISISPDGSQAIVSNSGSGDVSIINTSNNTVIKTVPVGGTPISFGNFIANNSGCVGAPAKFTITVNPSIPTITATVVNGTISACVGTASGSPYIQQLTVSGIGLKSAITATAPAGFEIALVSGSGYGNSIILPQTAGVVNATVIYVRSAATATAGSISGNVTLTSAGANSQTVAVNGIINAPLTINAVAGQTVNNGAATAPVNFNGTGNTVSWVNDTPGIGLPASGSGNIAPFTAINTGNRPVVATISATPVNSGYAYMANMLFNTISVVNTVNNTVAATIPVGAGPLGVAVSPDGSTVYVTNSGLNGGTRPTTMSEINTATNTVTTVQVGPEPYGIVLSPDGKLAYITVSNFNFAYYCNLAVFNTVTNTIVTYIQVGVNPAGVAINSDGSRVYVANSASNTVSVINTATNTVIADIAMDSPVGILISPDNKKLYVTNLLDNTISIVDVATNIVTAKIAVGSSPGGIAISPDGSKVYVANVGSNTVSVINTATNAITATIAVASNPNGICVSPDGSRVYAGSSVINTATNTVITTLLIPNASFGNFIASAVSCGNSPTQFTITVNPSPPTITTTAATGAIAACTGAVSASPNIQQFTVSGSGLTGNVTITAPTGFEVSLALGSGYGNNLTLSQAGGAVSNTIVFVRSAASLPNGITTANVVLSSPGATNQSVSVAATVIPVATSSLTISASGNNICSGTTLTFTATPTNGGSSPVYQWLLNGNNAGTNSPTFSSSTFANGDVVGCVMTSSSACVTPATVTSNSITISVAANVVPSINIIASQNNVCAGTVITFTATPLNGGSMPVYQWLVNGSNAGTNSPTFGGSNFADGDKITCMMTSNAACVAPVTVTSNVINVSVNPVVNPAINIVVSQNNICQGTNVTFTATPTNGGSSPVYQWLLNGNIAGINSPTFASSTLSNGDVISCRLTSNAACSTIADVTSNSITMAVNAQVVPTLSISTPANSVCFGTVVTFTASPINGGSSPVYQWLLNGNNAGANGPTFSGTFANGDIVSCSMTSSLACTAPANIQSNSITINIFSLPVVKGGGNKTIEKGNSVSLRATASGNIADITWSPFSGLDNDKILNPRASPVSTTLYTITVQTAEGCIATDSVRVTVLDGISIPNTFTPNGDGINDRWEIQNLKDYQNCTVYIFDSSGGEVFGSKGYFNAWDGTIQGRRLPVGVYYYIINLNDGTRPLSGFVTLIR